MSRIEQAGYPYVERSHGILFDQASVESGGLITGSRRPVSATLEESQIRIVALDDDEYEMSAEVDYKGAFNFRVYTALPLKGETVRHPDFFAGKFVDFALRNFEQNGVVINRFIGDWGKDSVNHKQFTQVFSKTGDRVRAAENTWSGRKAREHGFRLPSEQYVISACPERIIVDFIK